MEKKIYNTKNAEDILELFEEMKKSLSTEECDIVLRKAIRKTKVAAKEQAFSELKPLMGDPK